MNLISYILIATNILGIAVIGFFLYREVKRRQEAVVQKKELARRFYELSVLKHLSEDIGYSLHVGRVVEGLVSTVKNLLQYSSISYVLVQQDKLNYKIQLQESVGSEYLKEAKADILNAVYEIDTHTRSNSVEEHVEGAAVDEKAVQAPTSYFNIPLVIHNVLVAAINVSSTQQNAFLPQDVDLLYRVINQATRAVERLESIVETEKGKLNSLLLSIPTGAVMFSIIDNVLQLTSLNTSAKEYLGLTGDPDTFKVITSFGKSFNLADKIRSVLEDKKTVILDDIKLNELNIKVFISPVFLYGTGKVIGVSITMENITFEKQIQEVRETFTHMVVHELRAPLTSMKGASELLISAKLGKQDQEKMLFLIKDSTERMLGDIADLLDASKIEAGKFAISKSRSSINSVIEQRVGVFIHVAESKGITIEPTLSPDIPLFEFDVERIGQVLNNLFSNSIKYTHQGGKIRVTTILEGNSVKIEVADNGIGVPKEKQAILFGRYSQAGQGGFKSGSTGLGLYISKSIVQSHGGKIWLTAEEGTGTTVSFTIPMENPVAQQKTESSFMSPQKYLN